MNKLDQKLTRLTQDLHDVLEESARPISSEVSDLKTHMETRLDNVETKLARLEAAVPVDRRNPQISAWTAP